MYTSRFKQSLITFSDNAILLMYNIKPTPRQSALFGGTLVASTIGWGGYGFYSGYNYDYDYNHYDHVYRHVYRDRLFDIGSRGFFGLTVGFVYGMLSPITVPITAISVGILLINIKQQRKRREEQIIKEKEIEKRAVDLQNAQIISNISKMA